MNLAEVMESPRLKVERANDHIAALVRDSAVMPKTLYEITNGPSRTHALLAEPDCFDLTYRAKKPISKHFGAIMGDAVNNLRESLDYWMNNAVAAVGPTKKLHFPFSGERKDLELSRNYRAIEEAFPDAAKYIAKNIQPCRDTNLTVWAATSLCNENKHNDFLPVVSVANLHEVNVRSSIGGGGMANMAILVNADSPHVCIARSLKAPLTVQKEIRLACQITFPKGAVFENQPVVPTLTNMASVVSQTLDALETFIRPYCRR